MQLLDQKEDIGQDKTDLSTTRHLRKRGNWEQ